MTQKMHSEILLRAIAHYTNIDRSHDHLHMKRVVRNVMILQKSEGSDPDIIMAAACFHDCVKHDISGVRAHLSTTESAAIAAEELRTIPGFLLEKIPAVQQAIIEHSYKAGLKATTLESQILQDADRLETLGAVGIARIFSSTGYMGTAFYNEHDPLCKTRPKNEKKIAVDFMLARCFSVANSMNTKTAANMAAPRFELVKDFLENFSQESGLEDVPLWHFLP